MEHTHAADIVHGDIKPENFLIDRTGYLKLTDFGLSQDTQANPEQKRPGGTHGYMPPEAYTEGRRGKHMDWYGVGAVFFELLTGNRMVNGTHKERRKVISTNNIPSLRGIVSDEAADLFEWLTKPDYKLRAGCGQHGIMGIKKHRCFVGVDWENVEQRKYNVPWVPR